MTTASSKRKRRTTSSTRRPLKKKKTPLLEILTGIIIVAILTPNSFLFIKEWWGGMEINKVVEELYYHLVSAKNLAIKNNHPVLVSFNTSDNSFIVHLDKNSNNRHDPTEETKSYFLSKGVVFGSMTGRNIRNIWGTGPLPQDPVQIEGGGHTLVFSKQGGTQHSTAIYLMRKEDVGISSEFLRALRVSQNGIIQPLQFDKTATPPWH